MGFYSMLKGMGYGAGLMYFYDPVAGAHRRSLLRDQVISGTRRLQNFVDVGVRDLNNRACGMKAELRAMLSEEQPTDDVLLERVRATMGHFVSHPSAIETRVENGRATLRGPVLAHEARRLLSAVGSVRGVRQVDNELEIHHEADIPALQGESRRTMGDGSWLHGGWTPGMRLLATGGGLALMTGCLLRRNPSSALLGALGFGLFVRAATNHAPTELVAPTRGVRPPGERQPAIR